MGKEVNFIDESVISVYSGKGGDGAISFQKTRIRRKGKPDGGTGGRGGNIYIIADINIHTLLRFKYERKFKANNGGRGSKNKKNGAVGKDCMIALPPGTYVYDINTGELLVEIADENQKFLLLKGGKGGLGNLHYISSQMRHPHFALKGGGAKKLRLLLQLKLLADVALIGFPNAGKSMLISKLTNSKPKIANYPFTTLKPNLGIIDYRGIDTFIIADIPGLIERASEGAGLGNRFLKHIEKCRLICHLLDISIENDFKELNKKYLTIRNELKKFNPELVNLHEVILLTKTDLLTDGNISSRLISKFKKKSPDVLAISSVTGEGLGELKELLYKDLKKNRIARSVNENRSGKKFTLHRLEHRMEIEIEKTDNLFIIKSERLEKLLSRFDFRMEDSPYFFNKFLKKYNIENKLKELGVKQGDRIKIGDMEFVYNSLIK